MNHGAEALDRGLTTCRVLQCEYSEGVACQGIRFVEFLREWLRGGNCLLEDRLCARCPGDHRSDGGCEHRVAATVFRMGLAISANADPQPSSRLRLWLLLLCEEGNCFAQNAVVDSDEVASFRQELNGVGRQSQIGVVVFRPVSKAAVGKLVREKVFISFLQVAVRLLLQLLVPLRN